MLSISESSSRRSFLVGRPVPRSRKTKIVSRVELVQFLLRGDVQTIGRHVLGRLAARHQVEHLVLIDHGHPLHGDHVADAHLARGFARRAAHRHAVGADRLGGVAARLEDAHRPQIFVQSYVVHCISLNYAYPHFLFSESDVRHHRAMSAVRRRPTRRTALRSGSCTTCRRRRTAVAARAVGRLIPPSPFRVPRPPDGSSTVCRRCG